ncbi:MAG: iron ABC transporter permease [Actinomycetota bacterium]
MSKAILVLGGLSATLVAASVWSVTVGAVGVPVGDVLAVIGDLVGIGRAGDVPQASETVVRDIRLPRILLAVAVGGSLGLCGAALQGVFANPLADPGLIGTSSGAALGAVVGIITGLGAIGSWSTPVFAFIGALAVTALVYRIARHDGRTEVVTLVLTGIAINAMVVAAIGYVTFLADDQELRSIVFWQLGSMAAARWTSVGVAFAFFALGLAIMPRLGRALDLLALGEREASHLGVDTERLRRIVLTVSALVVGAVVAVAGIIAFVGLVVPHVVRLVAGPGHRLLLPASAVGGALLLVGADVVARTAVEPAELPLGVLTSAVGGGFFLWLLVLTRREQGGWA